jgi:hypothetical protein
MQKSARSCLAKTVGALIQGSGMSRRAWATAHKLDIKTVERAEKATHNIGIDFLDQLGKAAGREPCELLQNDRMGFDSLSGAESRLVTLARRLPSDDINLLCVTLERNPESFVSSLRSVTKGGTFPGAPKADPLHNLGGEHSKWSGHGGTSSKRSQASSGGRKK